MSSVEILQEIDRVSEKLCDVLDTANCLANTSPDSEIRTVAKETFFSLSEKVQTINTDPAIYRKLKHADFLNTSSESQRVASRLILEFEWEGAGIESKQARDEISVMQNTLRMLESQAEAHYQALPQTRPKLNLKVDGQSYSLEKSDGLFFSVMQHESNKEIRNQVYHQYFECDDALLTHAAERQAIREARHTVAKALGFASHAHFALNKNMVTDPKQLDAFLSDLARKVKSVVDKSFPTSALLYEWEFQRPTTTKDVLPASINEYFTVETSLQGVMDLCKQVFQLDMVRSPNDEIHVFENKDRRVGVIQLDLLKREGKSSHPCLYPLRTSCGTNQFAESKALLSCGFDPHQPIGHVGFRTLLHEFGHALHTVLSRTEYQHLSGTRGEMDFVETPSTLLERMAWDARVLRFVNPLLFAQLTDEHMNQKRLEFAALDLQEQVFHALFDLRFHLDPTLSESELYWDLRNEFGSFKLPDNSSQVRRELFVHHVLGNAYAGSMYSYVWGFALTCDLWNQLFALNPLCPESGDRLKKELFAHGGGLHPNQVLHKLLGRSTIALDAVLKEISIK